MGSALLIMLPITILLALTSMVLMSPTPQEKDQAPMPYKFNNEVAETDAEPRGIFWNQEEEASEANPGRVEGQYSVWLPDGRLMKVSYYVDGDSGFVPSIEYIDDYTPSF